MEKFTSHTGVDWEIPPGHDPYAALFSEELGAVIQIRAADLDDVSLLLRHVAVSLPCVQQLLRDPRHIGNSFAYGIAGQGPLLAAGSVHRLLPLNH